MADNYIAKFTPNSHFFTDPNALSQVAGQAFGPAGEDEFWLTTRFTVSAAKAFAICKGVVLVQPQTGSANLVNLILRPYEQPITGFNIKYFVYRGLKKSDFFIGDKVLPTATGTSDFITKINNSFASFYNSVSPGQPLPDFLAKYIGYDPATQADALLLSDFFFKESEYVDSGGEFVEKGEFAFELPLIQKGASLGDFADGECGIDVVLNYGDYKLPLPNDEFLFNLTYARASKVKIELSSGMSDYEKKVKKEQIFQFLDAAAYFGFHAMEGGVVEVDNSGTITKKKGEAIYTDVVSKFFTKNKLYLYIQSDRTRSYNFYGNYTLTESTNDLNIGIGAAALAEEAYGTDGWPLYIDDAPRGHNESNNSLYFQLSTDTGNNVNTMLYGQVAQIVNAQHNNFCGADDLQLPDEIDGTPSEWTKIIEIANPSAGPDGGKVNIASFNILLYQGKVYTYETGEEVDENDETVKIYDVPNFFDDVFDLMNAEPLLKATENMDFSILSSQKVKIINHYYDRSQKGISAVQTTIINDIIDTDDEMNPTLKRVTYITEAVDTLNTAISLSGSLTNDTKSAPSVSGGVIANKTYKLPEPFYYTLSLFTDNTATVTGVLLKAADTTVVNKIVFGLAKVESDVLNEFISTTNISNPRLFFVDLFEDGNQLISAENILYQKYKVGIVGELNTGELMLLMPTDDIIVYSLDRKFHFTRDYSKYMKEIVLNDEAFSDIYIR